MYTVACNSSMWVDFQIQCNWYIILSVSHKCVCVCMYIYLFSFVLFSFWSKHCLNLLNAFTQLNNGDNGSAFTLLIFYWQCAYSLSPSHHTLASIFWKFKIKKNRQWGGETVRWEWSSCENYIKQIQKNLHTFALNIYIELARVRVCVYTDCAYDEL